MSVDESPFRLGDVGGSGPAVLCLHGLAATPYDVRPPAEALAERGFACLGPRTAGHGQTPQILAGTSREEWLAGVLAAYDELAVSHARVYVLGLSMGGVLALATAARRPVAGAVVMVAPLQLGGWVRTLVPWLAPLIGFVPKRPAILDPEARAIHPGLSHMPLKAVAQLVQLGREVQGQLSRVTAPLRLIFSRRDPVVPSGNADLILAGVSSSEREVHQLSNSAHVITVDQEGAEVSRQVVEFFCKLEGRWEAC